jgi:hypothetical protein
MPKMMAYNVLSPQVLRFGVEWEDGDFASTHAAGRQHGFGSINLLNQPIIILVSPS